MWAMVLLCVARLAIAFVPLRQWSSGLGLAGETDPIGRDEALRLSAHVARAAWRLPFACECLPQAVALSRMLRRRGIPHRVVIAVRAAAQRSAEEALHAWVEAGDRIVIGDLPGPWHVTARFPRDRQG